MSKEDDSVLASFTSPFFSSLSYSSALPLPPLFLSLPFPSIPLSPPPFACNGLSTPCTTRTAFSKLIKKGYVPPRHFFFFFFTFLPHIAGDIWHSAPCLQCLCHCNCHLVLYRQRCFHSKLPARISTPDKSPSTSRPDISPRVGQLTGDNDYL